MRKYTIEFGDKRKQNVEITAIDIFHAIEKTKKKYGSGFIVHVSKRKQTELEKIVDDFYSARPSCRTKKRLVEMLINHFK